MKGHLVASLDVVGGCSKESDSEVWVVGVSLEKKFLRLLSMIALITLKFKYFYVRGMKFLSTYFLKN